MRATALPLHAGQRRPDRGHQTAVGIGDDQAGTRQSAGRQPWTRPGRRDDPATQDAEHTVMHTDTRLYGHVKAQARNRLH